MAYIEGNLIVLLIIIMSLFDVKFLQCFSCFHFNRRRDGTGCIIVVLRTTLQTLSVSPCTYMQVWLQGLGAPVLIV